MPARSNSNKGFAGIMVVELHFPETGSLKGKRMYLRSVRDQVSRRFGASVAEIGYQDLWQRSRLLIAIAASDLHVLEATMGHAREFLDSQEWILASCEIEVVDIDA